MIEIVLVAPVRAYRDALAAAFDSLDGYTVVAHAATGPEALAPISPRHPAVALVDFGMPDVLTAFEAIQRTAPTTAVIAIGIGGSREHSEVVVRAAEAGVAGFVDAGQPLCEIVAAVLAASRGEAPCSPRVAAILLGVLSGVRTVPVPLHTVGSTAAAALTPREQIVAELAASGLTNRAIASRLILGESTVKSHVRAVLRKLGIERREQIALALRRSQHA